MIGLVRGVFESCEDIFFFQERVVCQDLLEGSSRCQQFQNVGHTDAKAADARSAAALSILNRNTSKPFAVHCLEYSVRNRVIATTNPVS